MVPRTDRPAVLAARRQLTPSTYAVRFQLEGPFPTPDPGQFVMVEIPEGGGTFWRRAYSLSAFGQGSEGPWIEMMIKVVGPGTAHWRTAPLGSRGRILGPLGNGFPMDEVTGPVAMVAGGIGLPPLLHAMAGLAPRGVRCDLYLGAATADELIEPEGCARAAAETGGTFVAATDDGSAGEPGLVTAALERRLAAGERYAALWACGPNPMLRAVARLAAGHGLAAWLSLEERMACGVGVCLGCVVPASGGGHLRVCREGPVFPADAIRWEAL
ncbi:MAG TPA: dihydroorotate dehydrogenase electron transfer subunit [Acidobacteria bacterium]|nr:dihydroorotate dehydrogenase electron transfer subunit [Acidobacteriota bacterium]